MKKLLFILTTYSPFLFAQTITNGNFDNLTDWDECSSNSTEVMDTGIWHGGPAGETFIEVDAHTDFTVGTSDDMLACQTITGLTIGETYQICLDNMRRPGPSDCTTLYSQPATVTTTIEIDGGAVMSQNFSNSATTWTWTNSCFTFVANSTSHLLSFTPNDASSCGMLIDNIVISTSVPFKFMDINTNIINNKNVEITWKSEIENNNNHFIIERSNDGFNWDKLEEGSYSLLKTNDYKPLNGKSFYRVIHLQKNGNKNISEISQVNFSDDYISIYPNPSIDGEFNINTSFDRNINITVYNLLGEKISNIEMTNSIQHFNLPKKTGIYMAVIELGDKFYYKNLIIK